MSCVILFLVKFYLLLQASASNAVEQNNKEEESESLHTTLVLFSADDEFTSKQDMCLCCGSFGKDAEGQLIMCSQCGQSYHPYCVNVKVVTNINSSKIFCSVDHCYSCSLEMRRELGQVNFYLINSSSHWQCFCKKAICRLPHRKHTKGNGKILVAGKCLNLGVRGPGEKPSWGETRSSGTRGSHPRQES